MSTFDGRIKEYSAISIDKFKLNGYAKYYLLSHVHSDHLDGLQDKSFKEKIYCSEQSAKLLPNIIGRSNKQKLYKHLKDLLVPIPYNTRYTLETPEYNKVHLTFLPANHCLGSSIILIECQMNGTVVYAQDMRAEVEFVQKELGYLLEHRIQNLYMDTTCCYEDKMDFVTRKKSAELLVKKILELDDYHHIYIDCWQLGYEELFQAVADKFKKKVHVSKAKYKLYCTADPTYENILTTDASSTRFHSCNWESECSIHGRYTIAFHPKPTISRQIFPYVNNTQSLLASDLPYGTDLKLRFILPFSTHSSCREIIEFHKFVRPKTFTPCVAHGGYESKHDMTELLKKYGCKIGDVKFSTEFSSYSTCSSGKRRRTSGEDSATLPDIETWSSEEGSIRPSLLDKTNKNTLHSLDSSASNPKMTKLKNSPKNAPTSPNRPQHSANSLNRSPKDTQQLNNSQCSSRYSKENAARPSQEGLSLPLSLSSQYSIPESVTSLEENCIVISSDDENECNKPLLSAKLSREYRKRLKACKYVREEQDEILVSF